MSHAPLPPSSAARPSSSSSQPIPPCRPFVIAPQPSYPLVPRIMGVQSQNLYQSDTQKARTEAPLAVSLVKSERILIKSSRFNENIVPVHDASRAHERGHRGAHVQVNI